MHAFDHQLNLADGLRVIAHANQVWVLEYLIGNRFRERPFVIQCDPKCSDAIIFQPRFLVVVLVISRLNQNAIEGSRRFTLSVMLSPIPSPSTPSAQGD